MFSIPDGYYDGGGAFTGSPDENQGGHFSIPADHYSGKSKFGIPDDYYKGLGGTFSSAELVSALKGLGESYTNGFRQVLDEVNRQKSEVQRLNNEIQSDRSYHKNNRHL